MRKGYATASTEQGMMPPKNRPRQPSGGVDRIIEQRAPKVIDFGYQAVHETAVLAKKIVKA